jgi:hypothetical protein
MQPTEHPIRTGDWICACDGQVQVAQAGATCRMGGMTWMQGEADSAPPHARKYQELLTALIGKLRADLGAGKMVHA